MSRYWFRLRVAYRGQLDALELVFDWYREYQNISGIISMHFTLFFRFASVEQSLVLEIPLKEMNWHYIHHEKGPQREA